MQNCVQKLSGKEQGKVTVEGRQLDGVKGKKNFIFAHNIACACCCRLAPCFRYDPAGVLAWVDNNFMLTQLTFYARSSFFFFFSWCLSPTIFCESAKFCLNAHNSKSENNNNIMQRNSFHCTHHYSKRNQDTCRHCRGNK